MAGAVLFCWIKSYYTTEKTETDSRKYYYETPVDGEFVYDSETLKI